MRRPSLALAVALAGAVLTLGLVACGGGDDNEGGGNQSFDLTVGDSLPLTGDLADFGPAGNKAALRCSAFGAGGRRR